MSFRYPFAVVRPGYDPLRNPNAPTIGTATAGNQSASVTFTAPSNTGGGAITSYTVVSSGGQYNTGASSPITVSGLTNGTSYTFVVFATNAYGPGPNSAASNSVTPVLSYQAWSWGYGNSGTLGIGSTTDISSPVQIGLLNTWTKISGGRYHAAALQSGNLFTWGYNEYGQLGIGTSGVAASKSSPVQVGALTTWASVCAAQNFTVATKTDGTLWAWGRNYLGSLGLGNSTNYSSPKQVGSLTNWSKVVASVSVWAIKTDGTLWSWGLNNRGQLGLNTATYSYSSPVQVGSLTTWADIGAGNQHAYAVKTDGTLWAWGWNNNGQLGLGDTTNRSSPVQVGNLTNWSKVSVSTLTGSQPFSSVIKTDGTLWTWGNNFYGQLGLTTYSTNYSSPKQVGLLTNWYEVATGEFTCGAVKTNGTLWMWGYGNYGQLGQGNISNYSSPKQVGSGTTWSAVAIGAQATFALK